MVAWSVLVLDAIILSTVSTITLVCISHIVAGWLLRNHFEMGVRSPLLLTLSGAAGVCISCPTAFQMVLRDSAEYGPLQLLSIPMRITLSTSPYVLRGVRLLVMYNINLRERYGPYMKEVVMVKLLIISYGVLEALVWPLSQVYGVKRVASFTLFVVFADVLLTMGASLALIAKLRTTNDLFDMSSEIRSVAVCLMVSLVVVVVRFVAPAYLKGYVTITGMFVRYFATMWMSNVYPVRALLWRSMGGGEASVPWFPYVPWRSRSRRVVVGAGHSTLSRGTTTKSFGTDRWLELIMGFPPLLRAFTEYCRKALCSESLFYLIEVSEFSAYLEAAPADSDKAAHFKRFQAAVKKYVKDGAPFEINICSKTKAAVLKVANIESFQRLTLGEMSQVLTPAAKEVSEMLKDNVYDKFRTTEEYKQVAGTLEGTLEDD